MLKGIIICQLIQALIFLPFKAFQVFIQLSVVILEEFRLWILRLLVAREFQKKMSFWQEKKIQKMSSSYLLYWGYIEQMQPNVIQVFPSGEFVVVENPNKGFNFIGILKVPYPLKLFCLFRFQWIGWTIQVVVDTTHREGSFFSVVPYSQIFHIALKRE